MPREACDGGEPSCQQRTLTRHQSTEEDRLLGPGDSGSKDVRAGGRVVEEDRSGPLLG